MTLGVGVEHVIETAAARIERQVGVDGRRRRDRADRGRAARRADPAHQVRHLPVLARRAARRARRALRAHARPARRATASTRCSTQQRRAARPLLGPRRRARRRRRGRLARMQQAIRWNLFQVAQATWRAEGAGVPAKGLTGQAYEGHYFWDTEIYVLPFLAYTQPRDRPQPAALPPQHAAHGARRARASSASAARCSRGARSTARRRRPTTRPGTAQYHINADIAYADPALRQRRAATSTSSPRSAPRSSSRRRGCGRTSASTTTDGDVPHPRRDRARRVHDRRQRQPLHEPDGAVEPALRGARPSAGCATRAPDVYAALVAELGLRPERGRRRGSAPRRRCTCRTTTRAASTRRTPASSSARSGTSRARRRRSSRCCCTTTRS